MSVLTSFYRLKAEELQSLEANPELMDLLLGCSETVAYCEQSCLCDAPHLSIEKAWDEILIILCRTDHETACGTLDVSVWEDFDGFEEVRLYSPAYVKNGLEALENLKIEKLRAEALRRGLRTYSGEAFGNLLDCLLKHLQDLINFWREAAHAGEGIVSSTG